MPSQSKPTASAFQPRSSLQAAVREIFSEETDGEVARLIPLADVIPDRRQPRREFPRQIAPREYSPDAIGLSLNQWAGLVKDQIGRDFPLDSYLYPQGSNWERPEKPSSLEQRLIDLADLAGDILNLGKLTAPIKVTRLGEKFQIESGERRWLAHWLLYFHLNEPAYLQIPAFIEPTHSVWRQASENGVKIPLNAVAKARQIALLLMEIHSNHKGVGAKFADFDDLVKPGACDRPFYAQVADGNLYSMLGWTERIVQVMGLKSHGQVRQYRAILDVDDAIWEQADDEDWTEFQIREAVKEKKRQKSVTSVTLSTPPTTSIPVRVPASASTNWQRTRVIYGDVPDAEVADRLAALRTKIDDVAPGISDEEITQAVIGYLEQTSQLEG